MLNDTVNWFTLAKPNPTVKDFNVQLGCHFEEVGEMLNEIRAGDRIGESLLLQATYAINKLAAYLKDGQAKTIIKDEVAFLDSVVDQIVTVTGSSHFLAHDVVGALNEVNRSNFSKFDQDGNPIFLQNGKIGKSDQYSQPYLIPFIPSKT